jgi:hypothetical protein
VQSGRADTRFVSVQRLDPRIPTQHDLRRPIRPTIQPGPSRSTQTADRSNLEQSSTPRARGGTGRRSGLKIRRTDSLSNENTEAYAKATGRLGVLLGALRAENADLALVVERWESLPNAVKAGIVAMVKSTGEQA